MVSTEDTTTRVVEANFLATMLGLFAIYVFLLLSQCSAEQKFLKKVGWASLNMHAPGLIAGEARGASASSSACASNNISGVSMPPSPRMETSGVGNLARRLAHEVVDEAVDIFDSVAFAETHKERLQNVFEIGYRHRAILVAAVAFPLTKNALGKQHMEKKGLDFIKAERAKQALKWGSSL